MTLTAFVKKWTHPEYPPDPVQAAELHAAEHALGVRFPTDYSRTILEVGIPRPTIALLSAIVNQELDLSPVNDFFSPTEIVEQTHGWREIGMPTNLVAFASDPSGNMFCFDFGTDQSSPWGPSTVWFYDHDFETVEAVAPSFSDWIDSFCAVEPSEEDDPE